jgi:uncharacterized protein YndB with AHSA1/START domain
MKEQKATTRSQQHEIEIDATPEAVWRAITDADELAKWFVEQARVTPGEGGEIWVSWGEGQDGKSRIEVWEPGKRLRLALQNNADNCGPASENITTPLQSPMIDEYTIETRNGRTVLRLVNSGIPDSADWETYYDGTNRGWDMFFIGLRHYLENHPGKARNNIMFMQPIQGTIEDAWNRITGPEGLDSQNAIASIKEGERFHVKTSMGEELSGKVIMNVPPKTLVATVEALDNALLSMTFEEMQGMSLIYLTLATFGLNAEAASALRERWTNWLSGIFPLPQMPQANLKEATR